MYAFPIGVPRWPQEGPRWPEATKFSQNGSQKDAYKMATVFQMDIHFWISKTAGSNPRWTQAGLKVAPGLQN